MPGLGFLSTCRVGIKLNMTFWKGRGYFPSSYRTCSFGAARVHCCHLERQPPCVAQRGDQPHWQGAALLSFPKPAGQKTHLPL